MVKPTHTPDAADAPAERTVHAKEIFALAFPALGVLAAAPLYLLLDTAVVGRLGATALAGLGAATTIQSMVTTQLTFLSYGTTARSARKYGASDREGAIDEGVQATFVAVAVGLVLAAVIWCGAPWFTQWLAHDDHVAEKATTWLRVAGFGIPLVLVTMAGNGWLRGIQNTKLPLYFTLAGEIPSAVLVPVLVRHLGVVGSAWANLTGQTITSACFLAALAIMHRGSWRPRAVVMWKQLVMGRDLIARSLSFQIAFLSAAAVAGRFGPAALAAHQVQLQIWNFLTLVLDSLAIAAQALTGAALGKGTAALARSVGTQVTKYSVTFSGMLAAVFAVGYTVIPRLFTTDASVLEQMRGPWWLMILMILGGGVVFALDGVLLGAADAAYLRTISLGAVIVGFLPGVWVAYFLHTGLTGVWCGLVLFIAVRLIAVVWRFRSMRWAKQDSA